MREASARSPRAAKRRPTMRMRTEAWGLLDQCLVSGVNFLTVILLARTLVPASFGYFVLAFTLLQTAGTLQAALVTRPHNVLGAARFGRAYADYSTTAAVVQVVLTAALTGVALAAAAVAYAIDSSHTQLLFALVPALAAWQLQELGRRMLYTEGRLAAASATDLVAYGGQATALVVLWQLDLLTGPRALLTLAGAFAVGAAVNALQLRPALSGTLDASALSANWNFGKWLGVAEIGQWFSTQFYIYLAGAVVGAVASAALKAGQTLLGPMSVFLTFVTAYLPTVLTRELRASGTIRSQTRRSLTAILPVVLVYCVAVAVFAEPALGAVYGEEYTGYADVVRLFALYYVLLAFSTVAIAVLSAREMTRDVFRGQAAGAAVSLAIGWLLLREMGPAGGVTGMLLSWAVAMIFFLRAIRTAPEGRENGAYMHQGVSTASAVGSGSTGDRADARGAT